MITSLKKNLLSLLRDMEQKFNKTHNITGISRK
jgi:hypothetical protein